MKPDDGGVSGKGYPPGGWCLATVKRPKAGGEEPCDDDDDDNNIIDDEDDDVGV